MRGTKVAAGATEDSDLLQAIQEGELEVDCAHPIRLGCSSERTVAVGVHFGIPLFGEEVIVACGLRIPLIHGAAVLVLGDSGSGKSSILREILCRFSTACMVGGVGFPADTSILDAIAPGEPLEAAIRILTACGLGDPHLWIRRFDELSEGERFRARLARAVAAHSRAGTAAPLLCDEFCSNLHRRAAKAIAHNLRKLAARSKLAVIVAASNPDIIGDLQPAAIVRLRHGQQHEVKRRRVDAPRPISLRRTLRIERGRKKDYAPFAAMHYRATDELGFVDKVFVMRARREAELLGIAVYSHSALELSLRNQATRGIYSHNARRLNRCFRVLRRLVIHPDLRGCGLGHYLVRKTLPLVGTPYVECLANMGAYNPVFEKAGMKRIGQYDVAPARREALETLRAMDVDPNSREFTEHVAKNRRVRCIVARVVYDWYAATTAGGEARVRRQSPGLLARTFRNLIGSKPVYYLWRNPRASGRLHAG